MLENNQEKVIGRTNSGKHIYNTPKHPSHKKFTPQDHKDAFDLHNNLSNKAKDKATQDAHSSAGWHHALQYDKKPKTSIGKGRPLSDSDEDEDWDARPLRDDQDTDD